MYPKNLTSTGTIKLYKKNVDFVTIFYSNFNSSWIKMVQNKTATRNETPAEKLLFELSIKMCTVGIICTLLENCNLPRVLSILHLPGNVLFKLNRG